MAEEGYVKIFAWRFPHSLNRVHKPFPILLYCMEAEKMRKGLCLHPLLGAFAIDFKVFKHDMPKR